MRPRLAVTLGDVRGIGPEIVARALALDELRALCDFVLVGPSGAGIAVDESVGHWPAGDGDARGEAAAGRLAGRAVEPMPSMRRET